jgi:uncharacterized protein (DUF885 family)
LRIVAAPAYRIALPQHAVETTLEVPVIRRPLAFCFVAVLGASAPLIAQEPAPAPAAAPSYVPDLGLLVRRPTGDLRDVVERFTADERALLRRYDVGYSAERRAVRRAFYTAWLARSDSVAFDSLNEGGKVDWLLLRGRLRHELSLLRQEDELVAETAPLLPFAGTILGLADARRRLETMEPAKAADTLAHLADAIQAVRASVEAGLQPASGRGTGDASQQSAAGRGVIHADRLAGYHAAQLLQSLQETLQRWYRFYNGYDPDFTWWAGAPYARADSALKAYRTLLRERVVGVKKGQDEPIVGRPIGRQALLADLAAEMIPYTPEQLIAIARRELAWSQREMLRASREMGLGDDWRAALEKVKQDHVAPGRQPDLVRDLVREAIAYVEQHDLVTVPPLARDMWRMEMMSPARQKEAPFFLGGEVIQVSYPTDSMSEEDKLMSMRGNNSHFSRATAFHEMIPGHELQGFYSQRYHAYRNAFATPFYIEGWAYYWEMLLWDLGFTHTPEDRVGALFWRMHRSARIILSIGFHLGTTTPQQAIDFLVDSVGHERANATAEVRRWLNGDYAPDYQVAYMIGGLQFRALHHELVDSGRMTNRQFHDAVLMAGDMPVEMVRALLENLPLTRDYTTRWKFEGDSPR